MNQSSERVLLPCPFCGGTETTPSFSGVTKDAWAYVCCDECEACGPWVEAGEGAGDRMADAWNRRAALSTQPQQAVAWATMNEEGEPSMLFFDKPEARHYCGEGEEPRALGFIDPRAVGQKIPTRNAKKSPPPEGRG